MERRFVSFLIASLCVMLAYGMLVQRLAPPPPAPKVAEQAKGDGQADNDQPEEAADGADQPEEAADGEDQPDRNAEDEPSTDAETEAPAAPIDVPAVPKSLPQRWFCLGSLDPDSPYRMLVTLSSRGASIVSAALNRPEFEDLEDKSGFLGELALTDEPNLGGCRVGVVGPGTPAAKATPIAKNVPPGNPVPPGLRGPTYRRDDDGNLALQAPGDLIIELDGQPVRRVDELQQLLRATRPRQEIELRVQRTVGDQTRDLAFTAVLQRRPLYVLSPEPVVVKDEDGDIIDTGDTHPPSFLLSLTRLGEQKTGFGEIELKGLPSLREGNWDATVKDGPEGPSVEFRRVLTPADLDAVGESGGLEIIKRYRLATVPEDQHDNAAYRAYHLTFELEFRNLGRERQPLVYQLDGPSGLTPEGWWYSFKTNPTSFGGAGARDVVWRGESQHWELFSTSKIVKEAEKNERDTPLYSDEQAAPMVFAGCDAQYFSTVLLRGPEAEKDLDAYQFDRAVAHPVAELNPLNKLRRTDVSFRLTSHVENVEAGDSIVRSFNIFVGPKRPDVLSQYGLKELIVFGWFGPVSRILLSILHFFYAIVGNYGVCILMLTILVRGCMFPLGRKMAMNAQKMQELAPEMKKIADKYKNDMEKRTQAQRELFRKHSYNPFGGCLLMFLQLPIFIGLYRGLAVDISLRQAPLIPGISWCSNLAGPDKLWYWGDVLPKFLSGYTGWLGPYLNVLPLVTCVLFLVQQKMFTPPATDDQQKMQQQIMQFMMLFMAVLFFKVASGLCIYFIASSTWGLAERMLLPKTKKAGSPEAASKPIPDTSGNGASASRAKAKRKKQKRR